MTRRRTPEEKEALRALWVAGETAGTIQDRLGYPSTGAVYAAVRALGLPRRRQGQAPTQLQDHRDKMAAIKADWFRRSKIKQAHPPIVSRPSPTLFGFPIKELDPQHRRLVDDYLTQRRPKSSRA